MQHLILLYMCRHTPLLYICVLILLFYSSGSMCPPTPLLHICALIFLDNCRSGASASSTAAASEQAATAWQRCRLSGFAHVLGELISVRNTSRCTAYYV